MDIIGAWTCRSLGHGRLRVARIAALGALLTGLVAASARADFEAPVNLSNANQNAGDPHVAIDGAGNAVIAWYRLDGTYWRIQMRTRSAAGVLGAVQTLTSTGADSIMPRVAVNSAGNAVIVWQRLDNESHYRIQLRASPWGALSPVLTLSEAGESAHNAQVAVDNDGNAVVVWYRRIGLHYRVQLRTRSAGGGAGLGTVETLSPVGQNSAFPEVAVDADGDAIIVWRTDDVSSSRIQLRPRSAAGVLGSVQTLSLAGQNASEAKVAVDPDGNAVVVWHANDGTNWRVQARARSKFGLFGPIQTLSAAGQDAARPQVAVDRDGNAVIVWHRSDGTNKRIQMRTRAADGTLGPVQNLSAAGEDAEAAQVAVDRDGDAVMVWRRFDGSNMRVEARTRSADGTLGAIQTLSEAGQNASPPTVAVRRLTGKAVAVWSRFNGAKSQIQEAGGP